MTILQRLDLDQLATVTGGLGAAMQQDAEDPGAGPAAAAPQGGSFLGGLDQLLGLFQSEGFQQFLGGLRQIFGSFGQAAAPPQDAPGGE